MRLSLDRNSSGKYLTVKNLYIILEIVLSSGKQDCGAALVI